MNEEELALSKAAAKEMRKKERDLVTQFANLDSFPSQKIPAAVFMSGSPGAGKTEFSKNLIEILGDDVVRIDPDEIRLTLSQYKAGNAHLFQNAVAIGVDAVFHHALKHEQNFILDGTMAHYDIAFKNISKVLYSRGIVHIFYVYQDPVLAWKFTQDREKLEGRNITKEVFIRAFFSSKKNVNILKQNFDDKLQLHLIKKDYKNNVEEFKINVDSIDNYLKISYTIEDLERLLS